MTASLQNVLTSSELVTKKLSRTLEIIVGYRENFEGIDFILVSRILDQIEISKETNNEIVDLTIAIVDSLMNLDKSIIMEAQIVVEAAAELICTFWKITNRITETKVFNKQNMLVLSHKVNPSLRGIRIWHCNTICNVSIIEKETLSLANGLNISDGQIELSEKFINDILNTKPDAIIIFTIFFNNVLFSWNNSNAMSYIFGVQIPNYETIFPSRLTISFSISQLPGTDDVLHCATFNLLDVKLNGFLRSKDFRCHFFQQGYYFITTQNGNLPNISHDLRELKDNQEISYSEKLYRLETLTYYHQHFIASDLGSLSFILNKTPRIDSEDLNAISSIVNNVAEIETETLYTAQIESNFINELLEFVNYKAKTMPGEYTYTDGLNFNLLVCEMNVSNSIFISNSLTFCNKPKNKPIGEEMNAENVILVAFYPPQWEINHREESEAKFVCTIFRKNSFFAANTSYRSPVIGFSTTPFKTNEQNNLYISFNKSFNKTVNNCGYWELMSNYHNLGLWWTKSANFSDNSTWIICKYRFSKNLKYYALVNHKNIRPINLTRILEKIRDSADEIIDKFDNTRNLLEKFRTFFRPYDIRIVSEILSTIDNINTDTINYFCNIINTVMYISRHILITSQKMYSATDHILRSLEKIAWMYHNGKYNIFSFKK